MSTVGSVAIAPDEVCPCSLPDRVHPKSMHWEPNPDALARLGRWHVVPEMPRLWHDEGDQA